MGPWFWSRSWDRIFYVHLQVAMYRVMAATFYYHVDTKSPASNLFFWYRFYPKFSWLCFTSFSAVKIYVSRCIPPRHPHFLHLFLSITSSWFILPIALSLLILGFVHMFVRVSFMLEGFLRCPMTLGCPAWKRMALIEAVRKRLCLILQVVWPQDVRLDGVLSLSP